jgi:cytosine/adenosine deaminase-related metal-dependent hydrolase/ribose/xylose/arabinose/galactoside ABC-type transport system permease subunit
MHELFNLARRKIKNAIRDVRNGAMLWQKIKHVFRVRAWTSVALQIILILIVGNFTASRSRAFLSDFNLESLLLATIPLALVTMAQMNALVAGYLDISVGSIMTMGVIIASFIITQDASPNAILLGSLAILGMGILVGLFNATLVRWVKLPAIIATLATLSILDGISLSLRPIAAGLISFDFLDAITTSVGFVPVAFIVMFIGASLWDIWLYATPGGLTLRAVGYDAQAARRIGAATTRLRVGAFVLSGLMAAIASFFLAAQVGVGDPRAGSGYALTSIAAAVLGGSSLMGGRGTFIGAIVSALFLTLIINILPLLGLSNVVGLIAVGVLVLLGLAFYQINDLKELIKLNYKRAQRLVRGSRLNQLRDLPKVYVGDAISLPSARKQILLKGGTVLTMDPALGNFRSADVLIEGTKIAAVGPSLPVNGAEVIDASNMIVMPGFIDTHRHIWEGLLRNVGADTPLEGREGYIRFVLGKFAPSFRPQDAYIGNLVSALGALDAGITTLLDWSHIQGSPEHTDAVIKALQDSGMRAVFAYGFPWWGDWNDRQPSWFVRAAKEYFSSKDQMLTYALAAPGPEFVDFEIARDHWKLAREVDARITTHVGVGSYGMEGKVQEMGEAGLLRDDTTYIHCTTLNEIEIQMIVDTGGTVSLAAPVEMMMGHGMPPIQKFLDRGLKPSLSVDVETNVPGDMFTQMRSVMSLQRALSFERQLAGDSHAPERITSREVLEYATLEGARANGLAHKTGSLTPGKEADVVMLRTDKPNVFPVNDPIGAVVWSMDTGNVDSVFVAGKPMKRNGELLHVDWNAVKKAVNESRDYVMKKSGFKLPKI